MLTGEVSFQKHVANPRHLVVRGQVMEAGVPIDTIIDCYFDGMHLRSLSTRKGSFKFYIKNCYGEIPTGSLLALRVGDKPVWLDGEECISVPSEVCSPDGCFDIRSKLTNGYFLCKKGTFRGSYLSTARKLAHIKLYRRASSLLEGHRGLKLHISHGTLLGAVRERDFIAHDDDFDALYLSEHCTLNDVIYEREEVLKALGSWFRVSKGKTGHIKLHARGIKLDIMPAWFDGQHLNISSYTSMQVNQGWNEVVKHELAGCEVTSLACFEEFLMYQYGADWRTPDPSYRSRRKSVKEKMHRKALGEWVLQNME